MPEKRDFFHANIIAFKSRKIPIFEHLGFTGCLSGYEVLVESRIESSSVTDTMISIVNLFNMLNE